MMRIELYVDRNDRLALDIFPIINNENVMKPLRGKECYEFIKELCSFDIKKVTQSSSKEDIIIRTSDYIFTINEFDKVYKKKGTKIIRETINDFITKQKLNQMEFKPVQRKNKHTGKKIIAGLLVSVILATVALTTIEGKKAEYVNDTTAYYSEMENTTNNNADTTKEEPTREETTEIETEEETKIPENTVSVSLDYANNYNSEKAQKTRAYYTDTIKKYSKIYGLDYELMLAIATQERGEHSSVRDSGGAIGLFQIEDIWNNKPLSAYNYETNKYETIIVDEASLSDVFYNIKVGCMVFQTALRNRKYNIPLAITEYNMGCGNVDKILNACSQATGKTVQEIVSDPTNLDWMNFRYEAKGGDKHYLENVSSFMNQNTEINIYNGEEEINMNIKRK